MNYKKIYELEYSSGIVDIAIVDSYLFVFEINGTLSKWDLSSGEFKDKKNCFNVFYSSFINDDDEKMNLLLEINNCEVLFNTFNMSSDNRYFASAFGTDKVAVINLSTGALLYCFELNAKLVFNTYFDNSNYVILVHYLSKDFESKNSVFCLRTGKLIKEESAENDEGFILSHFGKDSYRWLSFKEGEEYYISCNEKIKLELDGIPGTHEGFVILSPDKIYLITGHLRSLSNSNKKKDLYFIVIRNIKTGKVVRKIEAVPAYPISAAISEDNKLLIAGLLKNQIVIYDFNTVKLLNKLNSEVYETHNISISKDNKIIAASGKYHNNKVIAWERV